MNETPTSETAPEAARIAANVRPHACEGSDDCGVCFFDVLHLPAGGKIVARRRGDPGWPAGMRFLAAHWRERGHSAYAGRIEAELGVSTRAVA